MSLSDVFLFSRIELGTVTDDFQRGPAALRSPEADGQRGHLVGCRC